MAISDELNRIIQAKAGIKSALEEKGLTIGDSSTLDEFPGLIQEMEVGGGGGADTSVLIDLIERDITSIEIPSGTTTIGNYAFTNCPTLQNVVIPNTITSVGNYAFLSSGITYINFNSANVSIGDYGFLGATKLSKIDLGNATYFGDEAFRNCNSLTSIIIPSTVIGWKSNTFQNTYNLNEYVVLTNSVLTNPGGNSFGPIPGDNKHIYVKGNLLADWKTAYAGYSNYMYPLAAIDYDSTTYTVTALGRDNLELYIDGELIDSSTYTFQDENVYNVTVKSVDPSLGVLDEVNEQIETPGYTGGDPEPAPDPEPEPEEPELEQLNPPEITITPDSNGYTVEITSTDNRANAIVYSIGDPNENENFDYTKPLLNKPEGTEIYAQARNEDGEYADSDWSSAVVGE